MTATERVRELLDERGVEWWPSDERWNEDVITHWYAGLLKWTAIEGEDGLWLNAGVAGHNSLTPEQAIAATLGSCNCTNGCTNGERTGTCHADETDTWECVCDQIGRYGKRVTIHVMECSECGHTYEHVNGDYEYCPHCGRRLEVTNG